MKIVTLKLLCLQFSIAVFVFLLPTLSIASSDPIIDSALMKLYTYNNLHQDFELEFTISITTDSSETLVTDTCTFLRYQQFYYSNCDGVTEIMNDSLIIQIDHRIKKIRVFPLDTLQLVADREYDLGQIMGTISTLDSIELSATDSTQTLFINTDYGFYKGMSFTIDSAGKVLKSVYYMPDENFINTYTYLYNKFDTLIQYRTEFDISPYIEFNGNNYVANSNYASYTVQILSEP